MLDFTPVLKREVTLAEFCATWTVDDLRAHTNANIDAMLKTIAGCADADVTFVAHDPAAPDGVGWTAGHVIAHATATAEESAFQAVELARGVPPDGGRSRYEMPWDAVTTVARCRQRLEESRRMRLASLELWPDEPHLDNTMELSFLPGSINAVARFALGLLHDNMHPGQLGEIVRQSKATLS